MESHYKIITGSKSLCEDQLNNLKKDYDINVISMASYEKGLSVAVLVTITPKQE